MKLRRWGQQVLLAICDVDLVGKTFKKEDVVFKISEDFYKGHTANVDEALDLIEKSTIVNLVGCNTVKKAVEKGYVHPEAVIEICNVLHAQIVKM